MKERKLVQWALAYAAGAFVVLQLLDALAEPLNLAPTIQRSILVIVAIGFLVTLVLAWYHGEKGRQRVSGPELVMVAALLVVAGVALSLLRGSHQTEGVSRGGGEDGRPGIAVLACENMSPNPEDAYYADGFHEEILLRLQRVSSLFSVGRATVLWYLENPAPLTQIALELGVGWVGECSLRKDENRIRVTFQLLEGATGGHLFAENYDRDLNTANLFDIQTDIAQQVAQAVGAVLTPEEEARVGVVPTENLEAYEAYLLGLYHLDRRDDPADAFTEAVRFFRLALQEDPDFAPSHAGLAKAFNLLLSYGVNPPKETWPQVERWARSALALDSTLVGPHLELAEVRWLQSWDWEDVERSFLRAIELSPSSAMAHRYYANLLLSQGRVQEARRQTEIAAELDPLSSSTLNGKARLAFLSRRFQDAIPLGEVLAIRDPTNRATSGWLGLSFLVGGHPERLAQMLPLPVNAPPRETPGDRMWLALYFALAGEPDSARVMLESTLSSLDGGYVDPSTVWWTFAALGDKDEAFDWMERGIEAQSYLSVLTGVTPLADPLRDDPRYQVLLDRIGLGHLKARFDSLAAKGSDRSVSSNGAV